MAISFFRPVANRCVGKCTKTHDIRQVFDKCLLAELLSFRMKNTINISEELAGNATTVARLLGYPEGDIGEVVETYADWEIESMANDSAPLKQAVGDLVWDNRQECQRVAHLVTEYLQLDTGSLRVIKCERGWSIVP